MARRLLQVSRDWAHDRAWEFFGSDRAGRIIMDPSFREKSENAKSEDAKSQDPKSQVANSKAAEQIRP